MAGRALNESRIQRPLTSHLKQQLTFAKALLERQKKPHPATDKIVQVVDKLSNRLQRPWRIAIMGELNSGKTAAINVLLGGIRLPTQAFANTHIHTLIHYSKTPQVHAITSNGESQAVNVQRLDEISDIKQINVGLPYTLLNSFELLDCPGISDYKALQQYSHIHREVDVGVWVTSSLAPLRKNEVDCWREMPPHIKKHSVLLVTRKDQLDEESQGKILGRLKYETRHRPFGGIILLSSTQALSATAEGQDFDTIWQASGADQLDNCLVDMFSHMQSHKEETIKKMIVRITNYFLRDL